MNLFLLQGDDADQEDEATKGREATSKATPRGLGKTGDFIASLL